MSGDLARQQLRLVESSVPLSTPVQRDGRHGVEAFARRHRGHQQTAQWAHERLDPPVLIEMDQFPKCALVSAKTISRVKTAKAAAAQSAAAFGIQRKAILKRCPATDTEEFRIQRLRFVQANPANRNARDFIQRLAANAAIVGEK
jgi:hypothetical protein